MGQSSRRCKRWTNEEEEDRLSSLPDAILNDILSRLSIHSAAPPPSNSTVGATSGPTSPASNSVFTHLK
uniref:Uncharacterized protein n=1 Tax=Chenopodium quinoa TaxID=63459 RepID=A0A803MF09_CHEQI